MKNKLLFSALFCLLAICGCQNEQINISTSPILTTTAASSVSQTTATSGGNVSSDGGVAVTARGVCHSTNHNPTTADSPVSGGSGTGSFISNLTGLTANTTYYVRAYATNSVGTGYGNEVSFTTSVSSNCPTTVTDIDGNVYNTVKIGNQCWMKENLKTTHYRDGSAILNANDSLTWANIYNTSSHTGAYCDYGSNTANDATYGKLYNWYAAADLRNVCPTGWHVPTDTDFTQLTDYLGGEAVAGGKMKAITLWTPPSTGADNSSGFTALPSGYRYILGDFNNLGGNGYFWSSTPYNSGNAWYRYLYYSSSSCYPLNYYKEGGFSVRCVGD